MSQEHILKLIFDIQRYKYKKLTADSGYIVQGVLAQGLLSETQALNLDVGKNPGGDMPEKLVGKITGYGWEWFARFFDGRRQDD